MANGHALAALAFGPATGPGAWLDPPAWRAADPTQASAEDAHDNLVRARGAYLSRAEQRRRDALPTRAAWSRPATLQALTEHEGRMRVQHGALAQPLRRLITDGRIDNRGTAARPRCIPPPRNGTSKSRHCLRPTEVHTVLCAESVSFPWREAIAIGCYLHLRPGELHELRAKDLGLVAAEVRIVTTLAREKPRWTGTHYGPRRRFP